ncbi:efflux RND transporter permease subunit [Paraglaciecola aquimarina]|uniref:Efflux RND transporter permease subunit n=1 Tax=Paraglaciecola algarum TaxID=3050085 RepID=A0ABS9D4N3_9ALTE|nr:efflux RND transporter permease subunit [Paraglaciecola sp. G1-23]MCF2947385.1 efflux RND transporter permease subunit [Paraglaciecola sp. G1-23]
MDIARYSLTKSVNIWLLAIVCIVGGLLALDKIGRLEDPVFTIKESMIMTYYPGASAEKVEKELTEQIEIALQKMPQLKRLKSTSKPGVSQIRVEVLSHYNTEELPQIWDELRKRLSDLSSSLPIGTTTPAVIDDFGDVYGLYYALTAPDFSPYQIREFSRIIRRELLTIDGVAKVDTNGILEEEIVATFDTYQIAGLGLSFPDVTQLLSNNLQPFTGGRLLVDGKQVRISLADSSDRIDEIGNLSIVLPGNNASIKLKDIAEISIQPVEIPQSLMRFNGEDAITFAVSAKFDVNIVDVGKKVNQKVDELLARFPAGIEVDRLYDQAGIVEEAVDGFILNLEVSVLVVTLALCLFMGWRSGVVVGVTLLITVLGTVLIMWLYDLRLQRISLGAMVIAMGMLVDNAIVVAEGIMMRMAKGKSALEAASFIVKRTQWPLLGATIIGIMAFSGIGLSNDATGEFLFSLFAVVLISLMLSWVFAVTLTPLLGKYFYKVGESEQKESAPSGFSKGYLVLLTQALRFRWISLAILVVITISAYASFGLIKQGFFPPSNAPVFFVNYWSPQGRDIRTTEANMKLGEQIILDHAGVSSVASFVGRGAERFTLLYGPEMPNESYGLFLVRVKDATEIPVVARALAEKLKVVDTDGRFYMKVMQFGPSAPAKLQARFSGSDPEVLRDLAQQTKNIYFDDPSIGNVRDDWREKGFIITPQYDEITAGLAGVSRTDFSEAIQFATSGLRIGQLQFGDYLYPIIAKSRVKTEPDIDDLKNSVVWSTSQRRYIPFQQISSDIKYESEELLIQRRDRVRTITISAEPGLNETAGAAFSRVRQQIEDIELPTGYSLEFGGEFESANDAQKALGAGLPLGFLVMFLISVLLFGRVRQPLIIWLIVPMAIVGVVAGLLTADMPFGFMSLLGFLSLFGMLIKNAIVLLEEIDLQINEGKPPLQGLIEASVSRLRPVALAAITTILGVMPLIFDPFFADMSVTIMGGLAFATLLTLIAVPVFYSIFFKIRYEKT